MLTFRFLHRVTLKIIATFLALTTAQAAEVVNLGVPTGTSLSLAGTLGRAKARPTSVR